VSRALAEIRFAWGLAVRRPFQCLIQVTNRCNMKCGFCDFWPNGVPSDQELTLDDYERLSADLARIGTFLVSIEGGEPLVRRDVPDIVRAFARHHLPVLFTNGWYVDAPLARTLFDAGLWQVGVSIDFADPARHDIARRQPGAGAHAWQAVEHFKAAARVPAKQVHVMSIVMKENVAGLEALLQASAARGVGHWLTLISDKGHRRGPASTLPAPGTGAGCASSGSGTRTCGRSATTWMVWTGSSRVERRCRAAMPESNPSTSITSATWRPASRRSTSSWATCAATRFPSCSSACAASSPSRAAAIAGPSAAASAR
jgi:molybdenum cofactor biosynthesis enzyme MoaA